MNTDCTPIEAARFWISRGFLTVPVKFRTKKPYNPDDPDGKHWQDLRITKETAARYFSHRDQNIGVILGDSCGTADVDLDSPEALSAARHFLPDTGMKFGRASKPASHWFYRVDTPVSSETFKDPIGRKTLLELRCRDKDGSIGHQTVAPPSIHESGEAVQFEPGYDRDPARLQASDLQEAVRMVAAVALLSRHWPEAGAGRHETMLALAGVIQRSGWSEAKTSEFCLSIYRAVPDHDPNAITRTESEVRDTFRNGAIGRATTGIPTLRGHLDERVVRHAFVWMGVDSAAPLSIRAKEQARVLANPLPEIWVGARQLPEITTDALAALQAANQPPELFARSGRVVAVFCDEKQRHIVADVSEPALRGRLARSAVYYKLNTLRDRVECAPPLDVVKDILALPPLDWKFPPLDALIETPYLRPDGSVCFQPGYDPQTYLFYAPASGLRLPAFPSTVMRNDVDAALDLISSAIGEFPFADSASKANAIASLLTPIVRPAIDGPTPLALYDAPQAGTGKTLLAEVVALVATGRAAETFSAPRDPEEWRKKITTALSTGASIVLIDNVSWRLDSDSLCMAITATTIADRIFRTFERIVLPVRCAWIATGNNLQLGGDMPRRCYWIRMDAKQSQPFRRTGFRHADLRAWVVEHRGELIAALLTIARYWYQQGRPNPRAVRTLGSFESWCNSLGGILELAGVEGFLGNAEAIFEQADADGCQWESFLLTLDELFGGQPFRVADIVAILSELNDANFGRLRQALPDHIAEAADRPGFFQRRLGNSFAHRVGKRFGKLQIFIDRADQDTKTKVQCWRVIKPNLGVSDPDEYANPDANRSL